MQGCVKRHMKTVALFGGSFNPPHTGHFEMACHIHEILGVDEVWFLVSNNWQKDETTYAPMAHRMEMGRLLAAHYPNKPFIMSDIQETLGTHITADVLAALRNKHPNTQFIWVMGADNFATLHTWERYADIIEATPLAIMDRPPYTEQAKQSPVANAYAALKLDDPKALLSAKSGWCFINNPEIDMSSSGLLSALRGGQNKFGNAFDDVAKYIKHHGLYGISPSR